MTVATTANSTGASLDTGATVGAAEWGTVGAAGRALERVAWNWEYIGTPLFFGICPSSFPTIVL